MDNFEYLYFIFKKFNLIINFVKKVLIQQFYTKLKLFFRIKIDKQKSDFLS